MQLAKCDYLTDRALRGLKAYKYKAGGYTWLDDLHNPMWNWIVEHVFPMWLAPNVVTLTGTLALVASHVLLAVYAPHMDGANAPWWTHLFGFCAILVYVNLDCMDGKQARRTASSSPLGQLFDHGCDALAIGVILINVATSVGLSCGVGMTAMLFASMVMWLLAQWEEYHTGMMRYGNGLFGVLEANYALAIAQLITALFGVPVWHTPVGVLLRMHHPIVCKAPDACAVAGSLAARAVAAANGVLDASFLTVICGLSGSCICVTIAGQIWHVFGRGDKAMDDEERGNKHLGPLNALKHLLMLVVFFSLGFMFLTSPTEDGLQCRALLSYFCLAYAITATQLILSHMAKEPWAPFAALYVGLVLGIVNSWARVVDQEALVCAMIAALIAFYLHYVINVIDQVCSFLGIRCLVIKAAQE